MKVHRSSKYKDLSYLVGCELIYSGGLNFTYPVDGQVIMIDEYKSTILVEFEWIYSYWYGYNTTPRRLKVLIPKASLVTGAVKLKVKHTGEMLIADTISDLVDDMECVIR